MADDDERFERHGSENERDGGAEKGGISDATERNQQEADERIEKEDVAFQM